MKIVEIFTTIQGEGQNIGKPSLFIRSGGCNLRCQFKGKMCDTPYAVFKPDILKDPRYPFWHDTSSDELTNIIYEGQLEHIVWTGGEPMLFKDEIQEVIENVGKSYTHEIETNGTIEISKKMMYQKNLSFSISVKLSSSNQEEAYINKRINESALKSFPLNRSVFKFVITDPDKDLKEIYQILSIAKLPVYVMPQGISRDEVLNNSEAVVNIAIEHGFRFSPREHINIWNTRKGV